MHLKPGNVLEYSRDSNKYSYLVSSSPSYYVRISGIGTRLLYYWKIPSQVIMKCSQGKNPTGIKHVLKHPATPCVLTKISGKLQHWKISCSCRRSFPGVWGGRGTLQQMAIETPGLQAELEKKSKTKQQKTKTKPHSEYLCIIRKAIRHWVRRQSPGFYSGTNT